jgi:hypothetical protein
MAGMSITSLWGFGGVKIVKDSITAEFDYAIGNVSYSPVYQQDGFIENIDRSIVSKLIGFRPVVTCSFVNVQDSDYLQFKYLLNILSNCVNSFDQESFTVYPRYDESVSDNIEIDCLLSPDSAIAIREIVSKSKCPQTLSLEFTGVDIVEVLPQNTDANSVPYWVEENNSNIVDESGNSIYFKE